MRSFGGSTVPVPIQSASVALWDDDAHVEATRGEIRARFDAFARVLGQRFGFYRPTAGFFAWLDVGDGERATRTLWEQAGLRVMPGAYLARDTGHGNPCASFIRVGLLHDAATVEEVARRLASAL